MKKILLCLLAAMCGYEGYGQNYIDGEVITADGISFFVESKHQFYYTLNNVENELIDRDMEDLNGNIVSPFDHEYVGGELDFDSFKQAFRETFSDEEAIRLRDAKSRIYVYMTKNSKGEVLEVAFSVIISPVTLAIPPSKFARYEKNLKKYVRWKNITEDEKKLKFMHQSLPLNLQALAPKEIFKGGEPIDVEELE